MSIEAQKFALGQKQTGAEKAQQIGGWRESGAAPGILCKKKYGVLYTPAHNFWESTN